MHKSKLWAGGLLALALLTGCSDPIKKVVQDNIKGLHNQDIKMVLGTMDAKSPIYSEAEAQIRKLLETYSLDYKLESITVLEKPSDEKKAEKKPEEAEKASEPDAEVDIFAEETAPITEAEREKAEKAAKKKEEEARNKPSIAKVKVVQLTRQKKGSHPFHANRVVVIHTLHKYPMEEKGTWKIYKSEISDVEFLVEGEKKKG